MPRTVDLDGLTFHPDFTEPRTAGILQSSQGVHFHYDLGTLAILSSFFRDLPDLPLPDGEDPSAPRVIPLPSATTDALALALNLISDALSVREAHKRRKTELDWPRRPTLDSLIAITKAYDLPLVADTFLARSARQVKTGEPSLCYERLAFAAATESPYLRQAAHATMFRRWRHAGDWSRNILKRHPEGMIAYLQFQSVLGHCVLGWSVDLQKATVKLLFECDAEDPARPNSKAVRDLIREIDTVQPQEIFDKRHPLPATADRKLQKLAREQLVVLKVTLEL